MLKLDSEVYSWLRRAVIIGGFCHALTVPPPVTLRVLLGFNWRTLVLCLTSVPSCTAHHRQWRQQTVAWNQKGDRLVRFLHSTRNSLQNKKIKITTKLPSGWVNQERALYLVLLNASPFEVGIKTKLFHYFLFKK